jgi:hypothetical protein
LAVLSTIPYIFVKPDIQPLDSNSEKAQTSDLEFIEIKIEVEKHELIDAINARVWLRRIFGYGLAAFTGIMIGEAYTPIVYMGQVENNPDLIAYLLSYNSGMLIGGIVYFIMYCVATKNKPVLYPNLVLAGFASGIFHYLIYLKKFNHLCFIIKMQRLDVRTRRCLLPDGDGRA